MGCKGPATFSPSRVIDPLSSSAAMLMATRAAMPASYHSRRRSSSGQGRLPANAEERAATPGKCVEHSPALSILAAGLLFTYLVQAFPRVLEWTAGGALIGPTTCSSSRWACCTGGPSGFYARLPRASPLLAEYCCNSRSTQGSWVITGTRFSESLTHLFATVTSHSNFAVLVGVYSAGLGCSFPRE